MKALHILTLILLFCFSAKSQNIPENSDKESKTEIMAHLASMPEVNVTYMSKSMLRRLPKDKINSPLALLAENDRVESIRLFQLGSDNAEVYGKKLIDSYLYNTSDLNNAELLMSQKSNSNEILLYGFPIHNDTSFFRTLLMYSKNDKTNALLLIIKGKLPESVIGDLLGLLSN